MNRLTLALRAYPRAARDAEGAVLLGLAADMIDGGSSPSREALGLVRGGLALRAGTLARAPWAAALDRLALPLALAFVAYTTAGATERLSGPEWPGWFWALTVGSAAVAATGLLARRRPLALLGAGALTTLCLSEAFTSNEHGTISGFYGVHRYAGGVVSEAGAFSLSAIFVCLPSALLLLAAATRAQVRTRLPVARTLAWGVAAVLAARLIAGVNLSGWAEVNGVVVLAAVYAAGLLSLLATTIARRRRDPAGLLAATLLTLAACPGGVFAAAAQVDAALAFLAVLAVAAGVTTRVGLALVRVSARAG